MLLRARQTPGALCLVLCCHWPSKVGGKGGGGWGQETSAAAPSLSRPSSISTTMERAAKRRFRSWRCKTLSWRHSPEVGLVSPSWSGGTRAAHAGSTLAGWPAAFRSRSLHGGRAGTSRLQLTVGVPVLSPWRWPDAGLRLVLCPPSSGIGACLRSLFSVCPPGWGHSLGLPPKLSGSTAEKLL